MSRQLWKRAEGFFDSHDHARLFFQTWVPLGSPKGLVVITHGQGEHTESYHRLVATLAGSGWAILAWDLRGHGRSEGPRGVALKFSDYIYDFLRFEERVIPKIQGSENRIYWAHSLGGLIQLKSLAMTPRGPSSAQILSNPFLGLALKVPAPKLALAQIARSTVPYLTLHNEIQPESLTRDPDVHREYEKDVLRHQKMNAESFLGAQECQKEVTAHPEIFTGPFLMLLSGADPVVSTPTNLDFFQRVKSESKRCQLFEQSRHELINDFDRDQVFATVHDFLRNLVAKD